MIDVIMIVSVVLMLLGYVYISEIISRCKRKRNKTYGCVPCKPTPPPSPPKHFIVTDDYEMKSYRYKNIWYDVTVQARNPQHACRLINAIFREKKQPLICFADQLKIVE